jgi:hypothetical protein
MYLEGKFHLGGNTYNTREKINYKIEADYSGKHPE